MEQFFSIVGTGPLGVLFMCLSLVFGFLYWRKTGKIYHQVNRNLSMDEVDSLIEFHKQSLAKLEALKKEMK